MGLVSVAYCLLPKSRKQDSLFSQAQSRTSPLFSLIRGYEATGVKSWCSVKSLA